MSGVREWVRVTHTPSGNTSVSVTVQEGRHTARWVTKAFIGHIPAAVREARKHATDSLLAMKEAS